MKEVKVATLFSILAEEVADISNAERLALVLRFVDQPSLIREAFLGFYHCSKGFSGLAISKKSWFDYGKLLWSRLRWSR